MALKSQVKQRGGEEQGIKARSFSVAVNLKRASMALKFLHQDRLLTS